MADYAFGAFIIEILTTAMYSDSKVIYREYIQNACDAIDEAEKRGILRARNPKSKYPDLGEGKINIWLYPDKRYIVIEDNATGIKASEFEYTLKKIADSSKNIGESKGFRGIGRLLGFAYCKTVVFTSRWIDEDVVSIMTCDALKMREMITEASTKVRNHSAVDVLNAISEFTTRPVNQKEPEHFFRVELIDINDENEGLFGGRDEDNIEQLTDYLSFVAPVPYQADFLYRVEIYEHARKLNTRINEYDIRINGEQVFKKYKTHLKTGNGQDEVFGVEFYDFRDDNDVLIGWLWFGISTFKAAIKEEEISRGLRLRKENIQIGEDDVLRNMFTREASKRGNNYFIGEVFATSCDLIPNSHRSYFNENPVRIDFEHRLKDYFNNTLYFIYYEGSDINSSIKKINSYVEKAKEFEEKTSEGGFLSDREREREQSDLEAKKQGAKNAKKNLEKKKESGRSILTSQIIKRRIEEIKTVPAAAPKESSVVVNTAPANLPKKFLVDSMFPQYNKNERKLMSEMLDQIFTIIQKSADKKTSAAIINRIKDELK